MTPHTIKADPETVQEIVRITTGKCFDWAQGAIAETMAAVAAELAVTAVSVKHEIATEEQA